MLNLYIGYPPEGMFKGIVYNPDRYFKRMDLRSIMDCDFAVRVAKACSDVATFETSLLMRTNSGRYISPLELSSGAKNLLILKNTDRIVNMIWCGNNCNVFVEEIAAEKDITVFTTRVYVPYKWQKNVEFRVLNTGKIYHSDTEYVSDYDIVDMLQDVINPDAR